MTETKPAVQEETSAAASARDRDISRFTKKKSKKKRLLIAGAVLLVAAVAIKLLLPHRTAALVSVQPLQRGELASTVSTSGTVQSAQIQRIYSTQGGRVMAVHVKTGDPVEVGALLAELDTAELELSVERQRISVNLLQQKNALAVAQSQQDYENLRLDLENGRDASVFSAEQALAQAQKAYTDAKRDLDEHKDELEYADEQMNNLERALNRARAALSLAKKDYETAVRNGDPDAISQAQDALIEKEEAYEAALVTWNEGNTDYGGELSVYSKAYRQARLDYEKTLALKEIADKDASRRLAALKTSVESSRLSADLTAQRLELVSLERQLKESSVVSPVSGTVTAVYAKEGMPGSGLLFVVEDTEHLVIKATVREYDLSMIAEGMPAVVRSDATGEKEIEGEVSHISPTAVKGSDGSTLSGTTVEFETDVSLLTSDSGLRVGMNVRMNIVADRRENVFSVPYDAVVSDPQGRTVVYRVRREENKTFAEAVGVTTGLETDFLIELTGTPDEGVSLSDGDEIILDPSGLTDGMEITVLPQNAAAVG